MHGSYIQIYKNRNYANWWHRTQPKLFKKLIWVCTILNFLFCKEVSIISFKYQTMSIIHVTQPLHLCTSQPLHTFKLQSTPPHNPSFTNILARHWHRQRFSFIFHYYVRVFQQENSRGAHRISVFYAALWDS